MASPRTGKYGHPRAQPTEAGGHSMLTPALHAQLLELRSNTKLFDAQVAMRCGVSYNTLKYWVKLGLLPNAKEPYFSFARDYSNAVIDQEREALANATGEKKSSYGEQWWLERRHPKRWGNRLPEQTPNPSADLDIHTLLEEATGEQEKLILLFNDPPAELEAAMRQSATAILAMLARAPSEPESEPAVISLPAESESSALPEGDDHESGVGG
jgi:hypothetical protein